jgi:hypothetical protein
LTIDHSVIPPSFFEPVDVVRHGGSSANMMQTILEPLRTADEETIERQVELAQNCKLFVFMNFVRRTILGQLWLWAKRISALKSLNLSFIFRRLVCNSPLLTTSSAIPIQCLFCDHSGGSFEPAAAEA